MAEQAEQKGIALAANNENDGDELAATQESKDMTVSTPIVDTINGLMDQYLSFQEDTKMEDRTALARSFTNAALAANNAVSSVRSNAVKTALITAAVQANNVAALLLQQ